MREFQEIWKDPVLWQVQKSTAISVKVNVQDPKACDLSQRLEICVKDVDICLQSD